MKMTYLSQREVQEVITLTNITASFKQNVLERNIKKNNNLSNYCLSGHLTWWS